MVSNLYHHIGWGYTHAIIVKSNICIIGFPFCIKGDSALWYCICGKIPFCLEGFICIPAIKYINGFILEWFLRLCNQISFCKDTWCDGSISMSLHIKEYICFPGHPFCIKCGITWNIPGADRLTIIAVILLLKC